MKKILILLTTLTLTTGFISGKTDDQETQKVYVVMSKSSYAYHKHCSCSAVKRSKSGVREVSLAKAKQMGKTPCKICYRH